MHAYLHHKVQKFSSGTGSLGWSRKNGRKTVVVWCGGVDACLSCEDIAGQSSAMVPKRRFFCVLYFQRAACSTFQTCILNSHYGHTMCGSMVDIQSAAAEIRRGKRRRKKQRNKPQGQNIMSASATQGGHNKLIANFV